MCETTSKIYMHIMVRIDVIVFEIVGEMILEHSPHPPPPPPPDRIGLSYRLASVYTYTLFLLILCELEW